MFFPPGFVRITALTALLPVVFAAGADLSVNDRDSQLSSELVTLVGRLHLNPLAESRKFAVSLADVTDPDRPRYAGVNDTEMMYAASLPKIAILLAAFEKISFGQLAYTPELREMFTRIARFSSNVDASKAVRLVGFDSIATTLMSPKYRLYDPSLNGGLWVGKAYGGPGDYWQRDPLHNLSHGATTLQVARFFLMLAQKRLVDQSASEELLSLLSKPGIQHKFVKGLSTTPGAEIYRKSGTWKNWHADAALIDHAGKRYIAVGLVDNPEGGKILERLIVGLDQIICGNVWAYGSGN